MYKKKDGRESMGEREGMRESGTDSEECRTFRLGDDVKGLRLCISEGGSEGHLLEPPTKH
jgi:hypothetical protein